VGLKVNITGGFSREGIMINGRLSSFQFARVEIMRSKIEKEIEIEAMTS